MHVREEEPPPDVERWFLLTTLPVESAAVVERTWRGLRWRGYCRILKAGCRELENRTAGRLQRADAATAAWRVRLGRELPDLPSEILFLDVELRALALCAARPKTLERPSPWSSPSAAISSANGTRWIQVARLRPARGFPSGT